MNPGGWLPDPQKPGDRLYFSKFRPFFTQAGVEVVDCPALTKAAKNGADIRMVIDVMTALSANTRYEEFVIASADADFTPLLQVLRADDRRVTVIATSSTATAYESLADRFLDEEDVFELLSINPVTEANAEASESTSELVDLDPLLMPASDEPKAGPEYEAFAEAVLNAYLNAEAPINRAALASAVKTATGMGAADNTWFGSGSFTKAVQDLKLPNVKFSKHYLWDATRHSDPTAGATTVQPSLPAAIAQFAEVTGMPRIPSDSWPVVYRTLESYAALHVFNYTEATKWCRDQAAVNGYTIPRAVFRYVVHACQYGGTKLNGDPSPEAKEIARALFNSVVKRAELAGLEISETERCELNDWIHHQEPGCQEHLSSGSS
jgi:hypothetical protein